MADQQHYATSPAYLRFRWAEWQKDAPDSATDFLHHLYDQEEYERRNAERLHELGFLPGRARRLLITLDLPLPEDGYQPKPLEGKTLLHYG